MTKEEEPIVVLNEEGDEFLLQCGEDLEPIEETIEFVDNDNAIQYTEDQITLHLLNILSFDDPDVLNNKSFWNRRAREFVELLQTSSDDKNTLIIPVIKGAPNLITDSESLKTDGDGDDEADNEILMPDLMIRRNRLINSKEPAYTLVSKMLRFEKLWRDDNNDSSHHIEVTFTKDSYVSLQNKIRKVFQGEKEHVKGFFYYTGHSSTIQFNTVQYLDSLNEMLVGDKVSIVFNDNVADVVATVVSVLPESLTFEADGTIYTYNKKHIHRNTFFVYTLDSNIEKFAKHMLKDHNICFSLLPYDDKGDETMSMFLPTSNDIVKQHENEYKLAQDLKPFKELLESYGHPTWNNIDEATFRECKAILEKNIQSYKQSLRKSNPVIKKFKKAFQNKYNVLDFEKYLVPSYGTYKFKNDFCDTEYHRTKHIFSQGDNGLLYLTGVLGAQADELYSFVSKNSDKIKDEVKRLAEELKQLRDNVGDCDVKEPDVVMTYSSIETLENDNFVEKNGINIGDYALLELKDHKKGIHQRKMYKRRKVANEGVDVGVWVFDRDVHLKHCNEQGNPKANELLKQKCIYDDVAKLCVDKEFLKLKNKQEYCSLRKNTLTKMLHFQEHFEKIKQLQVDNTERLQSMVKYQHNVDIPNTMKHEEIIDYSLFVGNVNEVDQDKYAHAEQGENIKYSFVSEKKEETKLKANVSFEESLIDTFGISVSQEEIEFIISNNEFYNNDKKLAKEIAILKTQALQARDKKLKELIEQNPDKKKAITDKLQKELMSRLKIRISDMETLHKKKSVCLISALYIIVVQLKLPHIDIRSAHPSCNKYFGLEGFPLNTKSRSLLQYVACIIRSISSANDETFGLFYKMSTEQIMNDIKSSVSLVLNDKPDLIDALKSKDIELSSISYKQVDKNYGEWNSFRPVKRFKNRPTSNDIVKYVKRTYELRKDADVVEKLAKDENKFNLLLKDEDYKNLYKKFENEQLASRTSCTEFTYKAMKDLGNDLFTEKDILMGATNDEMIEIKKSSKHECEDKFVLNFFANLGNEDFFDQAPDMYKDYFDIYLDKFGRGANFAKIQKLANDISRLFFTYEESWAIKIRNCYRNILYDDIRTLLGRVLNYWKSDFKWINKLPQLDKKKKEHKFIEDILSSDTEMFDLCQKIHTDQSFSTVLKDKMIPLIEILLSECQVLDVSNEYQSNISKNIQLYNGVLLNVIYNIIKIATPGEGDDDLFDITYIPSPYTNANQEKVNMAFELGLLLLSRIIEKLKSNIYDTKTISRVNDELREQMKQDIIMRLENKATDDKKTYIELQKRGLLKWTDIHISEEQVEENVDGLNIDELKKKDNEHDENLFDIHNQEEEDENYVMHSKGQNNDDDEAGGSDDEWDVRD